MSGQTNSYMPPALGSMLAMHTECRSAGLLALYSSQIQGNESVYVAQPSSAAMQACHVVAISIRTRRVPWPMRVLQIFCTRHCLACAPCHCGCWRLGSLLHASPEGLGPTRGATRPTLPQTLESTPPKPEPRGSHNKHKQQGTLIVH